MNVDRALAELPLTTEFKVHIDGVEADLSSRGRHEDGVSRIARITSIYKTDSLTQSGPGTRPDVDPGEFAPPRPSYRCLAWYLNRKGYSIGPDLLNDDRPEGAKRQNQANAAWLAARADNKTVSIQAGLAG